MNRIIDLRTTAVALAFLAIGFLAADRMAAAGAAQSSPPQEQQGASFVGTTGVITHGAYVIVVRDKKVWKLPVNVKSGDNNQIVPWVILGD